MKERFDDALRLAERFTRRYDEILKAFQEEMLNTTAILDQLNRQFGWVSQLANSTRNDKLLKVIMVGYWLHFPHLLNLIADLTGFVKSIKL